MAESYLAEEQRRYPRPPAQCFTVPVTQPPPGQEFSYRVPGGLLQMPVCMYYAFQASAAVASRYLQFAIYAFDQLIYYTAITGNVTAGTQASVSLGVGIPAYNNPPSGFNMPLPYGLILQNDWRIVSFTSSMQPTDQYQNLTLVVQQWPSA